MPCRLARAAGDRSRSSLLYPGPGFDEDTAALWVCCPNSAGDTPADWVAAGRTEDLREAIKRSALGFVG